MNNFLLQKSEKLVLGLYEEYNRYIYKCAWQYCNSGIEIDDLVQEVWLKICANPHRIATLTKPQLLAYLTSVVRNTASSLSRKAAFELPLEDASRITYNEADILNNILDKKLSVQAFRHVWPCVPEASRELLERKYFLEESDMEIASAFGIHCNSVRMYLSRARKTALSILDEYRDLIR